MVVQQVATATSLAASVNPGIAGATVRLTATVSAPSALPGSGAIDGNVTFMDGTTTLGTGAISPSSVATLDLNSLPVGSHSWSASHTGNVNYAISRSTVLPETVQLATTSVQLNSSFTFPIAGSGITLTAIVSGTGSVPTGTVTFYDGNASLGTSTVNGTGQANFSVSTLGAGSHAITASFGGDAKDSGSTSSPLAQLVLQAVTSIALTSSANPSVAGVSLTFIASLTSNGSLPKGQITLKEGSTTLAIGTLGVTGAYSFIVPSLAAGSHALFGDLRGRCRSHGKHLQLDSIGAAGHKRHYRYIEPESLRRGAGFGLVGEGYWIG